MRKEPLVVQGDTHACDRQQTHSQSPHPNRESRQEVARHEDTHLGGFSLTDKHTIAFLSPETIEPVFPSELGKGGAQPATLLGSG